MIRIVTALLAASVLLAAPAGSTQTLLGENAFAFIAIGDVPYYPGSARDALYRRLIDTVNAARPDLILHVGDFKSGSSLCTDERFATERDRMNSFEGAVIYTPGDNDWTDCHRGNNGGFVPSERLAKLRSMFFADNRSLGRQPIELLRQPSVDSGSPTPENAFWRHKGITFATVHVVGDDNNAGNISEFAGRDAANTAWIGRTFTQAAADQSLAVVLALHADMFISGGRRAGFRATLAAIRAGARAFGGPVLLIHGDSHRFIVDQVLMDSAPDLDNVTRLQVFGDAEVHAVRIIVDPAAHGVFSFQPIFVPGNTRSSRRG